MTRLPTLQYNTSNTPRMLQILRPPAHASKPRSLRRLRDEQWLVNLRQKLALPTVSNRNYLETKRGHALRGWQLQKVRRFRQVAKEKTHPPAGSRHRQRPNARYLSTDADKRRQKN